MPVIEEKVFNIQPLEIEPQIELVEKEVKIIKMEIHVRTTQSKVGKRPLVVVQVEIIKIIVEETNVDAPPNSLKDSNVKFKSGNNGRSWGMFFNSQYFGGKRGMPELQDGDQDE